MVMSNNLFPCDIDILDFYNLNNLVALTQSRISDRRKRQIANRFNRRVGIRDEDRLAARLLSRKASSRDTC
jgi:hypothetical protein